jgi:DNA-binding XRE family transcriptional regulator
MEAALRPSRNHRWEQAIPLLLAGMSKDKVAREVGVQPQTIDRWEQDPNFCRRRQEHLETTFSLAAQVLRNSSLSAVEKLLERVNEGDINAAVHVLKAVGLYSEKTAGKMNHDHGGEIVVRWDEGGAALSAHGTARSGGQDSDRPLPPVYSAAEVS